MNKNEKLLNKYAGNNMVALKRLVMPMILKLGIQNKYWDDLYDIALNELMKACNTFNPDKNCKFTTFLCNNVWRKYLSWLRDMNAQCRIPMEIVISYDIEDDEHGSVANLLGYEVTYDFMDSGSCKIDMYMSCLSKRQRKIVVLLQDGYTSTEIKKMLCISSKVYADNIAAIRSYENVKHLF